MTNKEVQFIAKQTMDYIKSVITPGMKLTQVRKMCEEKMLELGAILFCIGILEHSFFRAMKQQNLFQEKSMRLLTNT